MKDERKNIKIKKELHKQLRQEALDKGLTLQQLVEEKLKWK